MIKNANFSEDYCYVNTNILGDFQNYISVPLNHPATRETTQIQKFF